MAPRFLSTKLGLAHGNKQLLEGANVQEFRIKYVKINLKKTFLNELKKSNIKLCDLNKEIERQLMK